jgi:hypothetical protein
LIFARSRRSTLLLAAAGFTATAGLGSAAFVMAAARRPPLLVGALMLAAAAATAAAIWHLIRLRRWPVGRLGFFRDRLVVVQGKTELRAPWDGIEVATLCVPQDWSSGRWPELSVTDRLTVRLRDERPLEFRPAAFGLEPVGCRDLILRLRDNPDLRRKLPEFDSALDLATRPVVTGQLINPGI